MIIKCFNFSCLSRKDKRKGTEDGKSSVAKVFQRPELEALESM